MAPDRGWSITAPPVASQIRGLLLDLGVAFAESITRARRVTPDMLADQNIKLTSMAHEAIAELYHLFRDLDRRIAIFDKKFDKKIDELFRKKRSLPPDQERRSQDCDCNYRRYRRWIGLQERPLGSTVTLGSRGARQG